MHLFLAVRKGSVRSFATTKNKWLSSAFAYGSVFAAIASAKADVTQGHLVTMTYRCDINSAKPLFGLISLMNEKLAALFARRRRETHTPLEDHSELDNEW